MAKVAVIVWALVFGAAPVSYAAADQCQSAAKGTLRECNRACSDGACRKECVTASKADAAACRSKPGASLVPGLKGAGTANNPYQVAMAVKEVSLSIGGGKPDDILFAFTSDRAAKVRMYLTGYTSPIDVTFERSGSSEAQSAHFIKAPDYPAYARFDVEEGSYTYRLRLVDAPTTVTLRTVIDENCAIETQFYRIPFGGTCRD